MDHNQNSAEGSTGGGSGELRVRTKPITEPSERTNENSFLVFSLTLLVSIFTWRMFLIRTFMRDAPGEQVKRTKLFLMVAFVVGLIFSLIAASMTSSMMEMTPSEVVDMSLKIMQDANTDPTGFAKRCNEIKIDESTLSPTFTSYSRSFINALKVAKCIDNTSVSLRAVQQKFWDIYPLDTVKILHNPLKAKEDPSGIVMYGEQPRIVCLRRLVGELWKCMIQPAAVRMNMKELASQTTLGSLSCYEYMNVNNFEHERKCFSYATASSELYTPWLRGNFDKKE